MQRRAITITGFGKGEAPFHERGRCAAAPPSVSRRLPPPAPEGPTPSIVTGAPGPQRAGMMAPLADKAVLPCDLPVPAPPERRAPAEGGPNPVVADLRLRGLTAPPRIAAFPDVPRRVA